MKGRRGDRPLPQPVAEDDQVGRGSERADEAVDADQAVGEHEQASAQGRQAGAGDCPPEHGADRQGIDSDGYQQGAEVVAGQ
ncbi:hypothetical protein D3C71_1611230 [compost metagenome]